MATCSLPAAPSANRRPIPRTVVIPDMTIVDLDVPDRMFRVRDALIDDGERARADRFASDQGRRRFISCRGALRQILGARTGVSPSSIRFRYVFAGNPELEGALAGVFSFNLSHCE